MALSDLMKYKISKRAIDDIALLSIVHKTKLVRKYYTDWLEEFNYLSESENFELLDSIYNSENKSMDNACNECIPFIQVPMVGKLTLNKARHEILKTIHSNGTISKDEVQSIIDDYVIYKRGLQKDVTINLKDIL